MALKHRVNAYKEIQDKFGYLSNLTELSKDDIRRGANKLREEYVKHFEDCFPSELVKLSDLFKNTSGLGQKETQNTSAQLKMLLVLNEKSVHKTFTNVHISLRIYLSMTASNCSGERSF